MLVMKFCLLSCLGIVLGLLLCVSGCTEPPVREPVVTVSDISLSDVSLRTMTVNTTVNIYNPNPLGAKLSKLAFDVYYLDGAPNYLGHGEVSGIDMKANGNTTVVIPVAIGSYQAVNAAGSLVRKGSITISVNGSAFVDIKVTSFEKRFEQNREFRADDFSGLLPAAVPGTGINITEGIQQLGGLLG